MNVIYCILPFDNKINALINVLDGDPHRKHIKKEVFMEEANKIRDEKNTSFQQNMFQEIPKEEIMKFAKNNFLI